MTNRQSIRDIERIRCVKHGTTGSKLWSVSITQTSPLPWRSCKKSKPIRRVRLAKLSLRKRSESIIEAKTGDLQERIQSQVMEYLSIVLRQRRRFGENERRNFLVFFWGGIVHSEKVSSRANGLHIPTSFFLTWLMLKLIIISSISEQKATFFALVWIEVAQVEKWRSLAAIHF